MILFVACVHGCLCSVWFRWVDESTATAPPAFLYWFEQFMASVSCFFRPQGKVARLRSYPSKWKWRSSSPRWSESQNRIESPTVSCKSTQSGRSRWPRKLWETWNLECISRQDGIWSMMGTPSLPSTARLWLCCNILILAYSICFSIKPTIIRHQSYSDRPSTYLSQPPKNSVARSPHWHLQGGWAYSLPSPPTRMWTITTVRNTDSRGVSPFIRSFQCDFIPAL